MSGFDEVAALRARLAELDIERAAVAQRLQALRSKAGSSSTAFGEPAITADSSPAEKIALFRRLFAGRQDVFPLYWHNPKTERSGYAPACGNEWVRGICNKPQVKCGDCPNQAFIPVSDVVVSQHLRGIDRNRSRDYIAGVYPLLPDDTCWFLAADFDGEHWAADALAYLETCQLRNVPAALERSRSGEGGRVWIFFSQPVPASDARQLGACLMTETLERRPEVGFLSYDRFFPSQDTLPCGGFGNLIALPLQRQARRYSNSLFVNERLEPYPDQWAFLASLPRMEARAVYDFISEAQARDRVLGIRMPVAEDGAEEPWRLSPSRRHGPQLVTAPLPERVKVVLADGLYIDRTALPPAACPQSGTGAGRLAGIRSIAGLWFPRNAPSGTAGCRWRPNIA